MISIKRMIIIFITLILLTACGQKREIVTSQKEFDNDRNLVFTADTMVDGKLIPVAGVLDKSIPLPASFSSIDNMIVVTTTQFFMTDGEDYPNYLPVAATDIGYQMPDNVDPTKKYRLAFGGLSIGHPSITAGTLGGGVCYSTYGCHCAITNCHVAGCFEGAQLGDPIWQPGKHDGGKEGDEIGYIRAMAKPSSNANNTVDAAIFCEETDTIYPDIYKIGAVNDIEETVYIDMPAQKYGRSTEYTNLRVKYINVTAKICYDSLCKNLYKFINQIMFDSGGAPGDSGSLIITTTSPLKIIALLFAGNNDGEILANRIRDVWNAFVGIYLPGLRTYVPYPAPIANTYP